MKKVKIMLAAVTVVAVVGGALAFKAKDQFTLYCTDSADKTCAVGQLYNSTIDVDGPTTVSCSTEAHPNDDCGTIRVKFSD